MIQRYFAEEQAHTDRLIDERDAITLQKEAMEEEQSGEEGLLEEVKNDKGNISKGTVQKRIKAIQDDPDGTEELAVLDAYLALIEKESQANKAIKDAQKELDKKLLTKYKELTEDEVKTLVVDDKWMAVICKEVRTEFDRISQRLTQRIKELAERYATPLPQLAFDVEELGTKVETHLQKMGFVW
jgi:type I restriction enzyme M protein